ncbi:rho-type GTPase activating protein Rga6 [Schizosaccharomyces japonicus yFS275]|uniref:Rho-type GTPase activating protein Rga6 n=1 Tax=Schizosaccharomyces japonicus (strain yFS275 / FY16936) TaxID=402676 RepID=B6JUV7_SCHJY|nr:rho-type GTPase activating protein Rga6 [Schizosaccharomyces japonicus yFS275]EEB05036.1 rho-type GTPase activating protein Rga6 [Schizosaccharomyces japonicus yFS275]
MSVNTSTPAFNAGTQFYLAHTSSLSSLQVSEKWQQSPNTNNCISHANTSVMAHSFLETFHTLAEAHRIPTVTINDMVPHCPATPTPDGRPYTSGGLIPFVSSSGNDEIDGSPNVRRTKRYSIRSSPKRSRSQLLHRHSVFVPSSPSSFQPMHSATLSSDRISSLNESADSANGNNLLGFASSESSLALRPKTSAYGSSVHTSQDSPDTADLKRAHRNSWTFFLRHPSTSHLQRKFSISGNSPSSTHHSRNLSSRTNLLASSRSVFGKDILALPDNESTFCEPDALPSHALPASLRVPHVFSQCITALISHGLAVPGIFRISGSGPVIRAIMDYYFEPPSFWYEDPEDLFQKIGEPTAIDIAGVLKRYILMLPGGLLGRQEVLDLLVSLHHAPNQQELPKNVWLEMTVLALAQIDSYRRFSVFASLFALLHLIVLKTQQVEQSLADIGESTYMRAEALGIVFGPLLLGMSDEPYSTKIDGAQLNDVMRFETEKVRLEAKIVENIINNWPGLVAEMRRLEVAAAFPDSPENVTKEENVTVTRNPSTIVEVPSSRALVSQRNSALFNSNVPADLFFTPMSTAFSFYPENDTRNQVSFSFADDSSLTNMQPEDPSVRQTSPLSPSLLEETTRAVLESNNDAGVTVSSSSNEKDLENQLTPAHVSEAEAIQSFIKSTSTLPLPTKNIRRAETVILSAPTSKATEDNVLSDRKLKARTVTAIPSDGTTSSKSDKKESKHGFSRFYKRINIFRRLFKKKKT